MGNITFVVWRESLEAMVVMGVLWGGIRVCGGTRRTRLGMQLGLTLGAGAGLLLACGLAWAAYQAQSHFSGSALEWLQLAMVVVAWALMVHMVFWMRRHGPALGPKIRAAVQLPVAHQVTHPRSAIGVVCGISALAVAREGAETVVFVAGFAARGNAWSAVSLAMAVLSGVALAGVTVAVMAMGLRFASRRLAFRLGGWGLLLLAAGLLSAALDQFVALDGWNVLLPWAAFDPFSAPALWDSSPWLSDARGIGRFLADFAGYRAQPGAALLVLMVLYWSGILWGLRKSDRRPCAGPAV